MDIDKAIDKIRKCLSLAKSSNPHEAAAALRQAQALMREHGVTEEGVRLAEVKEASGDARMQTLTAWETMLCSDVAEAFGCRVLAGKRLSGQWTTRRVLRTWVFVGVGASAELAQYAYDVLSRQCARDRQAHISEQPKACKAVTKTARGDAFAQAWVLGVRSQLQAYAGTAEQTALLDHYMADRYPDLGQVTAKNRAVGRNVRDDSFSQGFASGRQARLERGLAAGPERKQIGAA